MGFGLGMWLGSRGLGEVGAGRGGRGRSFFAFCSSRFSSIRLLGFFVFGFLRPDAGSTRPILRLGVSSWRDRLLKAAFEKINSLVAVSGTRGWDTFSGKAGESKRLPILKVGRTLC